MGIKSQRNKSDTAALVDSRPCWTQCCRRRLSSLAEEDSLVFPRITAEVRKMRRKAASEKREPEYVKNVFTIERKVGVSIQEALWNLMVWATVTPSQGA